MRLLHLTVFAALIAVAPALFAQDQDQPKEPAAQPARPTRPPGLPPGPPGAPGAPGFFTPQLPGLLLVQTLDADNDGVITKEEIEGAVEALKKLDKDEDGSLSREEFMGVPQGFPGFPGGPPGGPPVPGEFAEQFVRSMLTSADKDGDEKISKDEASAGPLKENFDNFDANKDGQLDREELIAMPQRFGGPRPPGDLAQTMIARILEADKDGDGKISKEEAPDRLKENFDNFDGNKDGALDREEVIAMARRFGGGPRPNAEAMIARMLESSDKDQDGKISKDEATGRMKENFDAIDANKDGFADKEELQAMAQRIGNFRVPPTAPPGGLPERPGAAPEKKEPEKKE